MLNTDKTSVIFGNEIDKKTIKRAEKSLNAMFDKRLKDKEILLHLCDRITALKAWGYYDGAYGCVLPATGEI